MSLKFNFHTKILFAALLIISSCTKAPSPPDGTGNKIILSTNTISNATWTSATSGGVITGNSDLVILSRGICWNTDGYGIGNPTINNNKTVDGAGAGSFTTNLTGLFPNMEYFVRAYVTTQYETIYGDQIKFTTPAIALATVTTADISSITPSEATSGGDILSDGGGKITSKGVVYATSTNPTKNDTYAVSGSGVGSFITNITHLTGSTSYYLRAYVTNTAGTAYGPQKQFTTADAVVPTVTTVAVSNVTRVGLTVDGNVSASGGSPILQLGVCWNISGNPTVSDSKAGGTPAIRTDGLGLKTAYINYGLVPNTVYYIRFYATTKIGTGYGDTIQFTTLP